MTFKTILRTTLVTFVALMLAAAPAAAVSGGQDSPRAGWTLDLARLMERVHNALEILRSGKTAASQEEEDEEELPLEGEENQTCDDCSDGGHNQDPDG